MVPTPLSWAGDLLGEHQNQGWTPPLMGLYVPHDVAEPGDVRTARRIATRTRTVVIGYRSLRDQIPASLFLDRQALPTDLALRLQKHARGQTRPALSRSAQLTHILLTSPEPVSGRMLRVLLGTHQGPASATRLTDFLDQMAEEERDKDRHLQCVRGTGYRIVAADPSTRHT
ncbi:hypothetical protein ABT117_38595 [Streptomyces sp. NPDC002262]|uniref:hypothetical protein n=1 Tax=Streptomyces sp. NPDC002262 TaxID=3154414 RepID=UPI00332E93EB